MVETSGRSPEQNQSQAPAFNLGALSVGDIVRLNMALHFEEGHLYDLDRAAGRRANDQENFKFLNMLRDGIVQLATDDLDRAKEIVTALKNDRSAANEGYGYSQMTAVECASALSTYDYEFARDTLLDIRYNDDYNDGDAGDIAIDGMTELEARLTPEQRADYDLHVQQREG